MPDLCDQLPKGVSMAIKFVDLSAQPTPPTDKPKKGKAEEVKADKAQAEPQLELASEKTKAPAKRGRKKKT
jgi:hypothetical protein